jgi:glycosyltransferase involved in cell wall biosynthesis
MHSGFDFDLFTGIGRITESLGSALRKLGAEVDFLYGRGGGEGHFTYLEGYPRQFSVPEVADPWFGVRRFQRFVSTRDYDIVHSHARWAYHPALARAVFGGRYKLLTFVHGLPHALYREWREEAREGKAVFSFLQKVKAAAILAKEAYYQRRAEAVIVPSRGAGEDVRAHLGIVPRVVPYGVDSGHFRPDAARRARFRSRYQLSPDRPVILFSGTPVWRKGLAYLLEALAAEPGDWTLCLAGLSEAERLWAHERAGAIPLIDCGRVRDLEALAEIYCGSDLFVLPSLYEGLPMVLLEALASGLPAVVADCNGARDVLEDGANGFIVPKRDAVSVRSALRRLRDPSVRETLGRRARESVSSFTWEEMARRLLSIYREVAGS